MDPYSGLEEEESQPSQTNDDTHSLESSMHAPTPEIDTPFKMDICQSGPMEKTYHLRARKSNSHVVSSLRMSTKLKTLVKNTDTTDDDSYYKPTPERIRNTNTGLHEPSKSRLMAHAKLVQSHLVNSTKMDINRAQAALPALPPDAERNKKCPYCETEFYYMKSVETHIENTHSDKLGSKPNFVLGINNIPSTFTDLIANIETDRIPNEQQLTKPIIVLGKNNTSSSVINQEADR